MVGKYDLESSIWTEISNDAKNLIKKMLTYKYKDRVTAREALKHPWFKNAPSKK